MTTELTTALRLVDEMIDCRAQLHCDIDESRRTALESAISARAMQIRAYLDSADRSLVT
jgi:hypothetical protein